MINKITIAHFFSFGPPTEIVLNEEINILIGINGSGKSNFIKALQLLYEGIAGDGFEKLFSQKWGGFSGAGNFGKADTTEIILKYEFDFEKIKRALKSNSTKRANASSSYHYEIKITKTGLNGYALSEWCYLKNDNITTYLKTEKGQEVTIPSNEKENYSVSLKNIAALNQQELIARQLSSPDNGLFILKKAVEQISIYGYFDTTFESPIRQLSPYYSETRLLPDGRNLSFLLNYLNGNSTSVYDKISEEIKSINPHFRELVFSTPTAGKTLLSLKEKNLERAITVEHISDGTLRFLLLMSIFYNPNRGAVICLDEPEIGLHPDMIHAICRGIQFAAQNGTQVIVASHSPLLMNDFVLEDLLVFEKDTNNNSIVSSKSEEEFAGWDGEFLVGQMWLRGQIGGTRW